MLQRGVVAINPEDERTLLTHPPPSAFPIRSLWSQAGGEKDTVVLSMTVAFLSFP